MKSFKVKHAYSEKVCQAIQTSEGLRIPLTSTIHFFFPTDSVFILDTDSVMSFILVAYSPEQMNEFKTNWQTVIE